MSKRGADAWDNSTFGEKALGYFGLLAMLAMFVGWALIFAALGVWAVRTLGF